MTSRALARGLLLAAGLSLLAGTARAQVEIFGQNKIQYHVFDWRILEGRHVRLYHYREEEELARYALELAESSYADLAVKFRVVPGEKVPLVLYNSHHHFEETNLIPSLLPEGVAGFTEFMRGRVALPFTGSYGDLAHVIRHEMVHVFQRAKYSQVFLLHRRNDFASTPLWWTEGLAEYWSRAPASEAAMVLRDMTLNQGIPTVSELDATGSSAALYPIGADLVAHIASRFGEDRLLLVFEDLWRQSTFPRVLESVTGATESDITESWHRSLKERFFPLVANSPDVERDAESLLPEGVPARMPVTAPPGPKAADGDVVYLSTRFGRVSVFAKPLGGEDRKVREVLRGETEERFESFHPGQSRMDVSGDRELAIVAKFQDRDALYAVNLDDGDVKGPYHFEPLIAIFSPSWSPDGRELVFSSLSTDGMSDLYLYTIDERRLDRLTHDRNLDADPDWSPDGRTIVFSSDRGMTGEEGFENLWTFDLSSRTLSQLTSGRWNDRSPRWSPDGKQVLCTSDREGVGNPWIIDARGGEARCAQPFLTGTLESAWTPDGKGICFSSFRDGSFGIYRKSLNDSIVGGEIDPAPVMASIAEPATAPPASTHPSPARWSWPALPDSAAPIVPYRPGYSLDLAQGAVSYSIGGTFNEGFQAVLSDALNDRLMLFTVAYTGDSFDDFLNRLSFGAFYYNLAHRTHYGYGAFHYVGDYQDNRGREFFERRAGINLLASYPFSRFHRLESGFMLAHSDRSDFPLERRKRRAIGTSYIAWVRDASVWNPIGPVEGDRERIAIGSTIDLTHANPENIALVVDARRYVHVGGPLSYAMRVFGAISEGSDPEVFLLGGSWNLRGYRWNSLVGTRAFLLTQELRYPLLAPISLFSSRTFRFSPIYGAFFLDAGNAWEEHENMIVRGSYGVGARMDLAGVTVLRFDVAWPTDFRHETLPARFDVFIGWSF